MTDKITTLAPLHRKWVEALRSGKYQQGIAELCNNGHYCCLGVLAEISGKYETHTVSSGVSKGCVEFDMNSTELADYRKVGLGDCLGAFQDESTFNHLEEWKDFTESLAVTNDDGVCFSDIADFIEEHPEQIFLLPYDVTLDVSEVAS